MAAQAEMRGKNQDQFRYFLWRTPRKSLYRRLRRKTLTGTEWATPTSRSGRLQIAHVQEKTTTATRPSKTILNSKNKLGSARFPQPAACRVATRRGEASDGGGGRGGVRGEASYSHSLRRWWNTLPYKVVKFLLNFPCGTKLSSGENPNGYGVGRAHVAHVPCGSVIDSPRSGSDPK